MQTSTPIARRDNRGKTFQIRCALLLSLIIIASIFSTPTLRAQGAATRTETFALDFGGQVRIENSRGSTRVETSEGQAVRVVAEKRTPAGSSLDANDLVLMS